MTNTYLAPGDDTPEDIVRRVERGLYCAHFGGGQVDISNGNFVFEVAEAYLIEKGKIGRPVKNATLIGVGPEALQNVSWWAAIRSPIPASAPAARTARASRWAWACPPCASTTSPWAARRSEVRTMSDYTRLVKRVVQRAKRLGADQAEAWRGGPRQLGAGARRRGGGSHRGHQQGRRPAGDRRRAAGLRLHLGLRDRLAGCVRRSRGAARADLRAQQAQRPAAARGPQGPPGARRAVRSRGGEPRAGLEDQGCAGDGEGRQVRGHAGDDLPQRGRGRERHGGPRGLHRGTRCALRGDVRLPLRGPGGQRERAAPDLLLGRLQALPLGPRRTGERGP